MTTLASKMQDTPELRVFVEHLDMQLERLSDKMDSCFQEVLSLKRISGNSSNVQGTNAPRTSIISSRHSRVSLPSPRASPLQQTRQRKSGSGPPGPQPSSGPPSESSFNFPITSPSGPNSPGDSSYRSAISHARPLSARGLKMMDLDFARRFHAKEVCQEVKAMDDLDLHMKPFMRLVHRTWRDTVWELLDDPRSSWCAWILSQIFKVLVVTSIVTTTLQISEEAVVSDWKLVVQIVFDAIFFIECLLRVVTAPHKRSYFLDPLNWGDMLSALGLPVLAAVGFAQDMPDTRNEIRVHQFLLLFLPLARFLKLLRYFESFRLLVDAFAKSAEALPVLTYIMAFIVLLSGTSIYLAEDRENIPSMPHSLWLALVTMTTVGYGDYYPKTSAGYITVSALTFVSVLFLALPVGIIGAEFNMTWQRRAEMLLRTRIRNALSKWGYAAADVETLFEYADADNDGQLELGEFIELVRQMRIGVSVETAAKLFHIMDANQDGHIDRIELLRSVYPDEYAKHTQSISSDEMFFKTKRRIGMALERLDSLRSSVSSKMTINSSTPEDDAPNFKVSVFTDAVPAVPVLSDVAEHWDEDGVERQERSDTDVPKERDSL